MKITGVSFGTKNGNNDTMCRVALEAAQKAGAELIMTTEKDAVRFPPLPRNFMPCGFLRVEIVILDGHEAFNRCLSQICLG